MKASPIISRYLTGVAVALLFCSTPVFAEARRELENKCGGNDIDTAMNACNTLIKRYGAFAVYLHNVANRYADRGECDLAISTFQQAIKNGPDKTGNTEFNSAKFYDIHVGLARTFSGCKGDNASALHILDKAIQLIPDNAIGAYDERASIWRSEKDFGRALADRNTALEQAKSAVTRATVLQNRALDYEAQGELDKALADFDEANKLDPASTRILANRGEVWRLKGDLDRALVDQSAAIQSGKGLDLVRLYGLRADTYRYKGAYALAKGDYEVALKMFAQFIPAIVGLGLTYEKTGDPKLARAMYEKALDPSNWTRNYQNSKSSIETAKSRLAAFDSGQAQPTILVAPSKAKNLTSIPTPAVEKPTLAIPSNTRQGRRVALVIGNSAYKNVPALINPQKDSEAIATSLTNIGFEVVTLLNDLTREKLVEALRSFADSAENADWAMVYYAGHGMEVNGINYLIPVDAKIAADRDIEFEAVSLSQVQRAGDPAKKLKLIMLDACRDNPFTPRRTIAPEQIASASTAGGAIGTRSTNGRGLAEVKVQGATLVVYAAKDGQVALDGEGDNSPFAVAVVQRLATPGVEINKLFRLVRDDVMEATAGRQEPYTYGSLPGKEDFFFVTK